MQINTLVVKKYRELRRTKAVAVNESIPMHIQSVCPACSTSLETLCTLVGRQGSQKIRLGFCSYCGYSGYIDRPTKDWNVEYYSHSWDGAEHNGTAGEDLSRFLLLKEGRKITLNLIDELGLKKDDFICEMGVGYGEILKHLEMRGYTNLIGVENSYHRARIVNQKYGFPVFHGNFEGSDVQRQIDPYKPVKLIFSHHVLEHVHDPSEVIASVSRLQQVGDKFVLSLPNVEGEHSAMILFYLPHLHSFSKEAVELLLNKHGYQLIHDRSPNPSNIIVAAEKVAEPRPILQRKTNYRELFSQKLEQYLFFKDLDPRVDSHIYWEEEWTGSEVSRLSPIASSYTEGVTWYAKNAARYAKQVIKRLFPFAKQIRAGLIGNNSMIKKLVSATAMATGYSLIAGPAESRFTDPAASAFEVQFSGDIQLLIK